MSDVNTVLAESRRWKAQVVYPYDLKSIYAELLDNLIGLISGTSAASRIVWKGATFNLPGGGVQSLAGVAPGDVVRGCFITNAAGNSHAMNVGPNNGTPNPVAPDEIAVRQYYQIPIGQGQSESLADWSISGTAGETVYVKYFL